MLELRPNCECCDKDLPPEAEDARICSYECTFCTDCVDKLLYNVCPNCGGGFVPRPIRPKFAHRPGISLTFQGPSTKRRILDCNSAKVQSLVSKLKTTPPAER
ncbi:DUF1272 domain-containing protein [Aliiglaciecola sp. CAU 1673]|nr:DUF1272 domain-containing protein [Aliiglaciecola sp. CAU 1673]MDF2176736.1 DUF1272 domain-containing protein [Aliiglaciecola sp. CAU 1673]